MKSESEFEALVRDGEIDREAARLIREGMSPWQASAQGARIVDERRQEKARMRRDG